MRCVTRSASLFDYPLFSRFLFRKLNLMLRTYWSFIILFGISFFYILLDRLDLGSRVYVLGMKCFFIGLAVIPLALRILPAR